MSPAPNQAATARQKAYNVQAYPTPRRWRLGRAPLPGATPLSHPAFEHPPLPSHPANPQHPALPTGRPFRRTRPFAAMEHITDEHAPLTYLFMPPTATVKQSINVNGRVYSAMPEPG